MASHPDTFSARRRFKSGARTFHYHSLKAAEKNGLTGVSQLPFSLKILLENLLRHEDGDSVTAADIRAVARHTTAKADRKKKSDRAIAFYPARVLMQDFTGVPAVADLAAMRDALVKSGQEPTRINPLVPVDLVIDHSVMVDQFGSAGAFRGNVELEYSRNTERYEFLRWGAEAFDNFRVVPPGTGICHQVNLEHLSRVVWSGAGKDSSKDSGKSSGKTSEAWPDTLVGTDSHTTMVNGLGVLGWGVGGIEAEAAMLGQPLSMLIPDVVGFSFTGRLRDGVTATDLVLTVTEQLRAHGVVGKFVEFCGPGLAELTLEDRATIANMAPEYGATCGFFPVDAETLTYLKATGRKPSQVALVEKYAKAQGLFRTARMAEPRFTERLELDLSAVVPSLAGPKRPQDRVALDRLAKAFEAALTDKNGFGVSKDARHPIKTGAAGKKRGGDLGHGDVVIAAITSCTNTSNPNVMVGAGLLARNAVKRGMTVKPWVKTSLAPGSKVVSDYLKKAGLQRHLDRLGFNLVGYGCTTCIGNSGPLAEEIAQTIRSHDLVAASVLSGNRNFEGRVNPDARANYLASPMLVVAYALAGSVRIDLTREPLGTNKQGKPVFLHDLWPSNHEIVRTVRRCVTPSMFRARYGDIFAGDSHWRKIKSGDDVTYHWNDSSTYVRQPPFMEAATPEDSIKEARILALLGDSITTDHISPAGAIRRESPAGDYLMDHAIKPAGFNSYGSRRGNHDVMVRGTFANIRLRNHMTPETEGGVTRLLPDGTEMAIHDAAMVYKQRGVPLVVLAGREYGTGSSRDWAAKGTALLGVKAVIAQSFERIHRSNLIGMGVLPLCFEAGVDWRTLNLTGTETLTITGLEELTPGGRVEAVIRGDGGEQTVPLLSRIDTASELAYYRRGGILPFVLNRLAA